jgi:hypothetical protein
MLARTSEVIGLDTGHNFCIQQRRGSNKNLKILSTETAQTDARGLHTAALPQAASGSG